MVLKYHEYLISSMKRNTVFSFSIIIIFQLFPIRILPRNVSFWQKLTELYKKMTINENRNAIIVGPGNYGTENLGIKPSSTFTIRGCAFMSHAQWGVVENEQVHGSLIWFSGHLVLGYSRKWCKFTVLLQGCVWTCSSQRKMICSM